MLYFFLQGVYNPYAGQHYLQIYGVPGTVNTAVYPYGQLGQTIPSGHGYTAVPSYAVPGHQVVQFGGPSVNAMTSSPMPTIQSPYPTGTFCSQEQSLFLYNRNSNLHFAKRIAAQKVLIFLMDSIFWKSQFVPSVSKTVYYLSTKFFSIGYSTLLEEPHNFKG